MLKDDNLLFEINNKNSLLNHMYKGDNIRVIDGMKNNKKCIIICSSNGIYFPNTYEEFRMKIICNNYYEGSRLASFLIDYVERIILIRDIRKSFYVTGINEEYNSIDHVLKKLKKLTNGYDVVSAGGSAGGYMASIIGSYLGAGYVINAGGQWNLYELDDIIERFDFLKQNRHNTSCNKWFDLGKALKSNHVPILYLYGALNNLDVAQLRYAKGISCVYPIAIKSQIHAPRVSTEPYLRLLFAKRGDIVKIGDENAGEQMIEIAALEEQINRSIELPKGLQVNLTTSMEQKQNAYLDFLYEWVRMSQDMCLKNGEGYCGFREIAIYGKGRYCSLLINDLRKQNVEVKCIVETQPIDREYEGIPIVGIKELQDDIKIMIVVPYYDIEKIKEKVAASGAKVRLVGIDEYIKERYTSVHKE